MVIITNNKEVITCKVFLLINEQNKQTFNQFLNSFYKLKNIIMSDKKPEKLTTDDENNSHIMLLAAFILLAANQLRFKTPVEILDSLTEHFGKWGPNWLKFENIDLRTHSVIQLKNDLIVLIYADFDAVFGAINESILTPEDKAAFLIHERKVRSNAVVSEIAPGLSFDKIGHLWADVHFINTATPTSKLAPENNFIYYETYMGLPGIAEAVIPFANGNVLHSSKHHFVFTAAEVGKTMYVRCYYQITNGNRSPSSMVISFPII